MVPLLLLKTPLPDALEYFLRAIVGQHHVSCTLSVQLACVGISCGCFRVHVIYCYGLSLRVTN